MPAVSTFRRWNRARIAHRSSARARCRWPDALGQFGAKATYSGNASGKVAPGQSVAVCYEFDTPKLNWTVEFQASNDGTQATIASEIRNHGTSPVKLGRCRLLDIPDNSRDSHRVTSPPKR